MNKKRIIVLASLLKPVDDPRMYEKFALTMGQTNKYDINIIGFASKNIPEHPDIQFHPLFDFGRLSLERALAPIKYWQKLLQVKPELIIVNTHDLLLVSCAYGIIFGCKVVYDVQENYKQNIIWSSDLSWGLRYVLANMVRSKEQIAKRMIVHFFIAESCYMNECSFISNHCTLLENKACRPSGLLKKSLAAPAAPLKLIYSGTIAESYGIFDCIELVTTLMADNIKVHLTIIGYCPRQDTLDRLKALTEDKAYISLLGGDSFVPHQKILEELHKADFSLISYQLNPSNQGCIPTRIWECLAYKVPMIMKKEHPWNPLLQKFQAGISLDFNAPLPPDFLTAVHTRFYAKPIPEDIYWEFEGKKLLNSLETLF